MKISSIVCYFCTLCALFVAGTVHADVNVTSLVTNPSFDSGVEGWFIDVDRSRSHGYQGATYTNGDIQIRGFVEVWLPHGNGTLGEGVISQTIEGLPEGDYILEVDALSCNQGTNEEVTGSYLFATGEEDFTLPMSTVNGQPEHFKLEFTLNGETLTIGARIHEGTNANWVAFDNVKLTYKGEYEIEDNLSKLVINEIQTTNIDQFIDPSFNYGGWIELYNPSPIPVNIGGMIVSDDLGNSFQLPISAGIVKSGGYKNLWFDHNSNDGKYSSEAYKQVPFKLQYEGGVIHLSNAEGRELHSQSYPAAVQRTSYARTTDGGNTWQLTSTPTPEASNNGSTFANTQLPMPIVDQDAKVFTSPFTFNVSIFRGATLRYTTDGTTPTLDNGETSTDGKFYVEDTKVYRFRQFKNGYLPSSVTTRSFIYKDKDYYLPIVSVVTDPRHLYDDVIGVNTIGTNGISGQGVGYKTNRNRAWERPVNFEYLVPDASDGGSFLMALNQECDYEICGGWSRNFNDALGSSFRLKGGKYYLGQNFLPYPFFEDKPYIKNKTIVVRNGGNNYNSRIKDAGIHECIVKSGFNLDCQSWQPAHIFVNGEYMYMFNLREPNNKNHAYANYGIDTDYLDQFEINSVEGYVQKIGNDASFRQWMNLATELAADPDNDEIYEQICQLVDIEEYANYMAMECYSGCGDWLTNSNNVKGYRAQDDGRFRLVVMDQDSGFGSTSMLSSLPGHRGDGRYDTGRNFLIDIFLNMLECEKFRKRFIDAFCIVNGSVYEPNHVRKVVNAMADLAVPAMDFDGLGNNMRNEANGLISTITSTGNRNSRINNMRNYFGMEPGGSVKLSRNINGGTLLINGQEVPMGYFDGTLFAPVTLTAKAPAGYRFKGWASDAGNVEAHPIFNTSSDWSYYDQGSMDEQPWKEPGFDESGWRTGTAPLGYGNIGIDGYADYNTTLDYGGDSGNKRPTYYFRKQLHLDAAPDTEESYQLTYYVDDGFIAYVNGVEIGRYLMHEGEAHYSDYSTTYVSQQAATASLPIPNELLHAGDNIIAIEVHNTSGGSTDIYWTASVERLTRTESAYLTKDENYVLPDDLADRTFAIVATFEKLPEEQLLADIATPIKVNEVSAGNSVFINELFKKNDWIELYNTTDAALDVAGLYLSDNLDNPLKYQIPSGTINTIIPAHGHLVVWADKLDPVTQLHAPFKLSNNDGERVLVTSSDEFVANNSTFFEAHPSLQRFADCLAYNQHKGDQSVGRYPDGSNVFYKMFRPTIEQSNTSHPYDEYVGTDAGIMDFRESEFALALMAGWNWISHPFSGTIPVNTFKDHANRILGQSLEATYSSETKRLEGSLQALETAKLYKVEMEDEHTYEINGHIQSAVVPISLRTGWNWLGYPASGIQTISAALAKSPVEDGDIMLGQNGFAIYNPQKGWVGTLSTLSAGIGYMYKSNNDKVIRFNPANASAKLLRSKEKSASEIRYGYDKYAYPDVMGVIARLQVADEPDADLSNFIVTAYVGGECRGVSEEVDGSLFLTVYGVDGETLSFKATDEDGDTYDVSEHLTFASDVRGTLSAPQLLHVSGIHTEIPAVASLTGPSSYYTLGGVYAGRDVRALKPGLYIVRHADGSYRKVVIR